MNTQNLKAFLNSLIGLDRYATSDLLELNSSYKITFEYANNKTEIWGEVETINNELIPFTIELFNDKVIAAYLD